VIPDAPPSDEELAQRVRDGDDAAFGDLWERHARAGRTAARQFSSIADPDDLVSEAYLRIFGALQRGGGPHEAFRPYLYRTIRNVALSQVRSETSVPLDFAGDLVDPHADPETITERKTITARAFRTLPERWQTVLWYTEVEGMEPAEAAPYLGLAPNSVAALAYRAREGLRKAWLQAHVSDSRVPEGCRWTTEHMSDYVRDALTARSRLRFDKHLDECTRCTILLEEIDHLSQKLAVVLLPIVLGGVAATGLLADRAGGEGAATAASPSDAGAGVARSTPRMPSRLAIAVGAVVGMATLVTAAVAVPLLTASTPSADSPVAVEPADPPATPPAEPTSTPTPTAQPEQPVEPPARTTPPPPVVPVDQQPPATPVVTAPASGSLGNDPQPRFSGSGEPAARIELAHLSGPGAPGALASTMVAANGTWSTDPSVLADGEHVVRVTQVDAAGNRSLAVDVPLVIDTVALPPIVDTLAGTHELLPDVSGTAEPDALVEVRRGDGPVLGTTLADATGAWTLPLPDPGPDPVAITAVQTDPAGNPQPLPTPNR
jgi:RNA polymerase sigma factor (sigma-70 family)